MFDFFFERGEKLIFVFAYFVVKLAILFIGFIIRKTRFFGGFGNAMGGQ